MRQVVLYHGEDGYWIVECPSLPGCINQGTTKEEAIVNIREAINGYLAALEDDQLPVPPGLHPEGTRGGLRKQSLLSQARRGRVGGIGLRSPEAKASG